MNEKLDKKKPLWTWYFVFVILILLISVPVIVTQEIDESYSRGFIDGYNEGYSDGQNDLNASASTPAPTTTTTPTPTTITFRVTASVDCIYNNSVGNDLSYYYEADDKRLPATVTAKVGDEVPLYVKITEDDSNPDVGWWEGTVPIEKGDEINGFYTTVEVYVTEGSGRYSGNEAKFEVTFDFVPQ